MVVADTIRVPGDHNVRLEATDLSHQLPPQLRRVLHEAVRVTQEDARADAQHLGGSALLLLPDLGQPLAGHLLIVAPLVTGGYEDVPNLPALRHPASHAAGAEELRIVRVGDDDQGSFGFAHARTVLGHVRAYGDAPVLGD